MSERPKARRCPECNTVNRPTVPVCECGYVFDAQQAQALAMVPAKLRATELDDLQHESLEDQRHFHMHKLTLGWFMVAGGGVLVLASLALVLVRVRFLIGGMAVAGLTIAKGVSQVRRARRNLRALEGKDSNLPAAKLLSR